MIIGKRDKMKQSIYRLLAENTILETERLVLRPRLMSDDTSVFFLGNRPNTTRFVFPVMKTLEEAREYLAQSMRHPLGKFAVVDKQTNQLIGLFEMMKIDERKKSCEVMYIFDERYWNKGFASETLSGFLTFVFETSGLKVVFAERDSENVASGCVMEKAGMKKSGVHKRKDKVTKTIRLFVQYKITQAEWRRRYVREIG